ncbi:MAG TPA: hypothetical protein ENI92_07530 [Bacteroidetes bacterium]|nr:hypothetical protein [Bacteroidota bacterium]
MDRWQALFLIGITSVLAFVWLYRKVTGRDFLFGSYLTYTFVFFLSVLLSVTTPFVVAVILLALLSFYALREYFSLVDIRLQDRLGVLGAYLLIPFLYYFVAIDWYGMFIISVPVYGFLLIPLLIALGGKEARGTIFSIGAIDFGLFLYIFCLGHIAYLLSYSPWMPVMLILIVAVSDAVSMVLRRQRRTTAGTVLSIYLLSLPLTVGIALLLAPWTGIPWVHSLILGAMIPLLAMMGRFTGLYIKRDLVAEDDPLLPGKGQVLDNLRSFFYAAPVAFHYIRYFLK